MVRGLMPLPDRRSRCSRWWGWRWERGQKKCPGDEGRCHCIGGVNSYGAEILIKENRGNPNPGCTKKAAAGVEEEEENRKTLKGRSSAD